MVKKSASHPQKGGLPALADDISERTEDELLIYKELRQAQRRRRSRRRRLVAAAAAVLLLCVIVYFNWDHIAPQSAAETVQSFLGGFTQGTFPLSISQGNFIAEEPLAGNIVVLSDTSVMLYSHSGALLYKRQHGMNNPWLAADGGRALVYDRGGRQFKVETRFDEPFTGSTDYPIITGDVSSSGRFAVVTESREYLSELSVYNTAYKRIFKWETAKGRIVSAAMSPDGNRVAAVLMSAKEGGLHSDVYIMSLGSQTPVAVKGYDGTLFFSIVYNSEKHITAVGDSKTVFLDADGAQLAQYAYTDKLCSYSNGREGAVLCLQQYGKSSGGTIVAFSPTGEMTGKTAINFTPGRMFSGGNTIAAISQGFVWYADRDLKKSKTVGVEGETLSALPFKGYLYVFGISSIERYPLE